MPATKLILVGGFLGAGKTTLLTEAARRLAERGLRVGLVTNDQAEDLVDTQTLAHQGLDVREVAGGCFCCRFSCLVSASELLADESDSDVVLAEPVGSCTDLSATVLQPLKTFFADRFAVAPLTVLADPARVGQLLEAPEAGPLGRDVSYILQKQLEEADLIVLNKADLLEPQERAGLKRALAERYPGKPVHEMAALTGEGVAAWLEAVLAGAPGGASIAEVDYDTYAAGEAALGWLNASVRLDSTGQVDWAAFCRELLEALRRELAARSAEIAHLKLALAAPGGQLLANLTGNQDAPSLRGALPGSPRRAELTVNARVRIGPDELRQILEDCLAAADRDRVQADVVEMQNFSPARPQPTHRFDRVVPPVAPDSGPGTRQG